MVFLEELEEEVGGERGNTVCQLGDGLRGCLDLAKSKRQGQEGGGLEVSMRRNPLREEGKPYRHEVEEGRSAEVHNDK